MASASYYLYSFFKVGNKLMITDTIFGMSSQWFDSKSIDSHNGCFYINLNNSMFGFKFPVVLKEINDKLDLTFDASKVQTQNSCIVFDIDIKDFNDKIKTNDSISLYPDIDSKEQDIRLMPLKRIARLSCSKAAFKFDESMNFYQILTGMKDGMGMSIEQYNSGIVNYDTKWFLKIESDSINGWIRKIKDYEKLGFMMYE
jgi:hypothetical protein